MHYVYILENKERDFYYVGITEDLQRRIVEHGDGKTPITKGYLPLKLVWYCAFPTKEQAAKFEMYLKSVSGRAFSSRHLI